MKLPKELIELTLALSSDQISMHQTKLPGLRIARSEKLTTPIPRVYSPSLCLIVQGSKDSVVGAKSYRYGPGQYLVNSVAVPVTGQITKASVSSPYLCIVLEIDSNLVYELSKDLDLTELRPNKNKSAVFIDESDPLLNDAILRLLRCLRDEQEIKILAPLILKEITFRLLHSRYGQVVRQTGVDGSQIQRISSAIEQIRKHFSQPLRLAELAKTAHMSVSTFHQHFKEVTKMSPLQYQKQIRLHEARRLLLSEAPDAANAGFQVGYESPSQFNREYSRMFGLPPLKDLKRTRKI